MLSVPAVLILVPFNWKPLVALTIPVAKVALVPLSVKVSSVFGVLSASLMVKTPLVPAVASVRTGAALERVSGDAPESATLPEAAIVVTPEIAPALVIPLELLSSPPVIDAPPVVTVRRPPIV